MQRTLVCSWILALCPVLPLAAQEKAPGGSGGPKIDARPVAPPPKLGGPKGHDHGKAAWKGKHPQLALELGKHPRLTAHLEAHPGLFAELRADADADRNGVLDARERGRFLVLLRASRAKQMPPGHARGKAWWKQHHPALVLELERHPRLYAHLIANPGLYMRLRAKIDRDGNGKLSARERGHFVQLLRKDHDRTNAGGAGAKSRRSGHRQVEKRKAKAKHRGKGKKH